MELVRFYYCTSTYLAIRLFSQGGWKGCCLEEAYDPLKLEVRLRLANGLSLKDGFTLARYSREPKMKRDAGALANYMVAC
jgi:hypothetical protein